MSFLQNTGIKCVFWLFLKSLMVWGKVCKDSTHHYFGVETDGERKYFGSEISLDV